MSEYHTLKAALKAKGWTQRQLADYLGVTNVAVNHWATGKEPVPVKRLAQLREVINYVPQVGTGSEGWDGAMENLGEFLQQGPLGFLVLAAFPKVVEMTYPRPDDTQLW